MPTKLLIFTVMSTCVHGATRLAFGADAPRYTATLLTLNGRASGVNGVAKLNNAGVVGIGGIEYAGAQAAAIWRTGGDGEVLTGTYASEATLFGLNDAGTAVGWSVNNGAVAVGTSGSPIAGYAARADGTMTYYPVNFTDGTGYIPNAINSAGVMAGYSEVTHEMVVAGSGVNRSFTAGWGSLHVYALNAANQTVGIYDYARNAGIVGLFYDDGNATHTYSSVLGRGQVFGYDLSDRGVIAGSSSHSVAQLDGSGGNGASSFGFLMFRPGDETDPGLEVLTPMDGYTDSWTYAVNDSNWAVGLSTLAAESCATLWNGDDGTGYDLNSLVDDLPAGMRLWQAMDINDRGQIVAEGDGNSGGYLVLLTPVDAPVMPEPGACALAGMAAGGFVLLRHRRA